MNQIREPIKMIKLYSPILYPEGYPEAIYGLAQVLLVIYDNGTYELIETNNEFPIPEDKWKEYAKKCWVGPCYIDENEKVVDPVIVAVRYLSKLSKSK